MPVEFKTCSYCMVSLPVSLPVCVHCGRDLQTGEVMTREKVERVLRSLGAEAEQEGVEEAEETWVDRVRAQGMFVAVMLLLGGTAFVAFLGIIARGYLPSPVDLNDHDWHYWHLVQFAQFLLTVGALWYGRKKLKSLQGISPGSEPTLAVLSLLLPGVVCIYVLTSVGLGLWREKRERERVKVEGEEEPPAPVEEVSTRRKRRRSKGAEIGEGIPLWVFGVELGVLWLLVLRLGLPDSVHAYFASWIGGVAVADRVFLTLVWMTAGVGLVQALIGGLGLVNAAAEEGEVEFVGGLTGFLVPVVALSPLAVHVGISRLMTGTFTTDPITMVLAAMVLIWGVLAVFGAYFVMVHWAIARDSVLIVLLGYFLLAPAFSMRIETLRERLSRGVEERPPVKGLRAGSEYDAVQGDRGG